MGSSAKAIPKILPSPSDPTWDLDVYEHTAKKMVIMIRRLNPHTDWEGVYHRGTGKGISMWFGKMRFARSGKPSAGISSNTSTSHALFFTKENDWVEKLSFVSRLSRDNINNARLSTFKTFYKGWTFVGNEDHKLGESIGMKKPGHSTCKRYVADLMFPEIKTRIDKMTEYVEDQYTLTDLEKKDLLNRCVSTNTNAPIITISDLFAEACDIIITKMRNAGVNI